MFAFSIAEATNLKHTLWQKLTFFTNSDINDTLTLTGGTPLPVAVAIEPGVLNTGPEFHVEVM